MSHPFHKGIKGQTGGSMPSVQNNLLKACGEQMKKGKAQVESKLAGLKNPVSRVK